MLEIKKETRGVVITGAAGFIGSATVDYYLNKGWRVLALDNQSIERDFLTFTYYKWNLFDEHVEFPTFITNQSWDVFIHFAWAGSAGPARNDLTIQIQNAEASQRCVGLASLLGCKKFVGAGSLMEYEVDAATHKAIKITSINYYGYAKSLAHYMCKLEANRLGIDFIWGIITNVYGPTEVSPRFINTTIRKIINREALEFSSGLQYYDFVFITDAAQAFYCMGDMGEDGGEYVVGSNDVHRLSTFVMMILEACDSELAPHFDMSKRVDCALPKETFDIKNLWFLGYTPKVPFIEGIKKTKEWIEKNDARKF